MILPHRIRFREKIASRGARVNVIDLSLFFVVVALLSRVTARGSSRSLDETLTPPSAANVTWAKCNESIAKNRAGRRRL